MRRLFWIFAALLTAGFTLLFVMEGPFFDVARQDLSAFIPADLLVDDSWYAIYFNGDFAGYSHSLVQIKDNNRSHGYLLQNTVNLTLPVFSVMQPLYAQTEVQADSHYVLESAKFSLRSSGYKLSGDLTRNKLGAFDVTVKTPGQTIVKTVGASRDIVNAIPGPFAFSYVPLKKKARFYFFDPFLDKKSTIILENRGLRKVFIDGKEKKLYLIDIDAAGVKGILYADEKGRMVKEEFMGFSFVRGDADKLISRRIESAAGHDLAGYFVVDCGGVILPGDIKRLKVRVKGVDASYLAGDYNQSREQAGNGFFVEIKSSAGINAVAGADLRLYLGEDDFIKFNDPGMRKAVTEAVAGEKDPVKILERISSWIDRNIAKAPTVSFPNSLDVLRLKRGDCNELSALEIAMLRSAGIPAYANIGLVYSEGKFYYHAWPSVYAGRWIDTDPALGETIADCRRVKLLKGFSKQFELFKVIGKIKLEIVDYD